MQVFAIVDYSEKGKDFIVAIIQAADYDEAIDKFCDQSVATREHFEDGPLDAYEYYVTLG